MSLTIELVSSSMPTDTWTFPLTVLQVQDQTQIGFALANSQMLIALQALNKLADTLETVTILEFLLMKDIKF